MPTSLQRLYDAALAHRGMDPAESRTARLFSAGRQRMAKKLGEEAMEVVIEAIKNDRTAVIAESADLLYQLIILLADMEIPLDDLWQEMDRREAEMGIAEKNPKVARPPAAETG